MSNKILYIFIAIVLSMSLTSCSSNKANMSPAESSKVLASVENVQITQQQVDTRKKDSGFSQQERDFSDNEVLEKLVEEQLLLIKAKELNITMSDDEVKESYKEMLQLMSSKQYVDGDENKLDEDAIEALRNMLIIQKTKEALGADIDSVLAQLKQQAKIEYCD